MPLYGGEKEAGMSVIKWSVEDGVGNIVMTNGENRHNPVFLAEMAEALNGIEADKSARAAIISSDGPKFWSLGIDLDWVLAKAADDAGRAEVSTFLFNLDSLYKRVLSYPMPVIAAISGHAYGGGAIFSCACDFRFMVKTRGFFCFPEVDVNIPFLPGMYAIVKKSVPQHLLNDMALTGRRISGAEAEAERVVVKAVEKPEDLAAEVEAFAKTFAKGRGVFAEQKRRCYKHIFDVIDRDDPEIIEKLNLIF